MIELRRITAGVLDRVSVAVPPGVLVAVVGAPGAGKSSLLRVASGMERPLTGHVVVDGEDLTGRPPYVLAGHGVRHVARSRGVYPQLTVRENIYVQAAGTDVAAAVDAAVLTFPVLGRALERPAGSLSRGHQQLLALCEAVTVRCGYMLLDDVLADVPPDDLADVTALLERLTQGGCGVLLTATAGRLAADVADRVHVLNQGRLEGTVSGRRRSQSFSVSGFGNVP